MTFQNCFQCCFYYSSFPQLCPLVPGTWVLLCCDGPCPSSPLWGSVAWFTIGVNPSKVIWNVLWRTQSALGSWCPFMSVPEWCCCICSYARLCLIVTDSLNLLACVHHSTAWVHERTSLRCWKSPEKWLICRTLCWMEPKGMILKSLPNVNPKNITSPSCSAQVHRIH